MCIRERLNSEKKTEEAEVYQHEEVGAQEIIKRSKISKTSFQAWVRNYKAFGRNSLLDKVKARC